MTDGAGQPCNAWQALASPAVQVPQQTRGSDKCSDKGCISRFTPYLLYFIVQYIYSPEMEAVILWKSIGFRHVGIFFFFNFAYREWTWNF